MDKKSRVKACMDRQEVDRPPFAVWRHFTETQGSREEIGQYTRQLIKQMGTRGFMLGGGGGYAPTLRSEAVRWIGEVLKE